MKGLEVHTPDYLDEAWDRIPAKANARLIYCSMPDRGLEHLARLFPRIRDLVPSAGLIVTGDYSLYRQQAGAELYAWLFSRRPVSSSWVKSPGLNSWHCSGQAVLSQREMANSIATSVISKRPEGHPLRNHLGDFRHVQGDRSICLVSISTGCNRPFDQATTLVRLDVNGRTRIGLIAHFVSLLHLPPRALC